MLCLALRISLPCALCSRIHGIWVRNGRPTYFEESEEEHEEEPEEDGEEEDEKEEGLTKYWSVPKAVVPLAGIEAPYPQISQREKEEDEDPPILVDRQPVIVAQARCLRPDEVVPSGQHIVTAEPIPREVKAVQPALDRRPSYDAGRGLYLHEYEALAAGERKQSYDPGAPASRSGRATRDSSPA